MVHNKYMILTNILVISKHSIKKLIASCKIRLQDDFEKASRSIKDNRKHRPYTNKIGLPKQQSNSTPTNQSTTSKFCKNHHHISAQDHKHESTTFLINLPFQPSSAALILLLLLILISDSYISTIKISHVDNDAHQAQTRHREMIHQPIRSNKEPHRDIIKRNLSDDATSDDQNTDGIPVVNVKSTDDDTNDIGKLSNKYQNDSLVEFNQFERPDRMNNLEDSDNSAKNRSSDKKNAKDRHERDLDEQDDVEVLHDNTDNQENTENKLQNSNQSGINYHQQTTPISGNTKKRPPVRSTALHDRLTNRIRETHMNMSTPPISELANNYHFKSGILHNNSGHENPSRSRRPKLNNQIKFSNQENISNSPGTHTRHTTPNNHMQQVDALAGNGLINEEKETLESPNNLVVNYVDGNPDSNMMNTIAPQSLDQSADEPDPPRYENQYSNSILNPPYSKISSDRKETVSGSLNDVDVAQTSRFSNSDKNQGPIISENIYNNQSNKVDQMLTDDEKIDKIFAMIANNRSIKEVAKQLNPNQVELLKRMANEKGIRPTKEQNNYVMTNNIDNTQQQEHEAMTGPKSAKIINYPTSEDGKFIDGSTITQQNNVAKRQQQLPMRHNLHQYIQNPYTLQQQAEVLDQSPKWPQHQLSFNNQEKENSIGNLNRPFDKSNNLNPFIPTMNHHSPLEETFYFSTTKSPIRNYKENYNIEPISSPSSFIDSNNLKIAQGLPMVTPVPRLLKTSASHQHTYVASGGNLLPSASPYVTTSQHSKRSNNNNLNSNHHGNMFNNHHQYESPDYSDAPYVMLPDNGASSLNSNNHDPKQQYFGFLRALPHSQQQQTSGNGDKSNKNGNKSKERKTGFSLSSSSSTSKSPTEASQTHQAYHLAPPPQPNLSTFPYHLAAAQGYSPARTPYVHFRYPHMIRPILAGLQHRVGFGTSAPYSASGSSNGGMSSSSSGSDPDDPANSIQSSPSSSISNTEPMWSGSRSQQQEDDYIQAPQTIQITAVPSALNGWNGANTLGGWNGGWGGPYNGRQVLLVNRQPGVSNEWRQWLLPVAIVLALPLVLGALFVPVLLKSVMFLIQILQMLGLLMPPGQLAGHLTSSTHNASSGR